MNIYLSKTLEKFLGTDIYRDPVLNESIGNWNADIFTVAGKNCVLFMNDKNCFAMLMSNVKNKELKNPGLLFRERLIAQRQRFRNW